MTWPGWEDSAVPPEQLGDLPARPSEAARQATTMTAALYGHFGHGLYPLPHRLRPAQPSKASSNYRGFHRRGGRPGGRATAARFPASMATASRAPSCCPRCSATSSSSLPRVQGDLGPGREDESRQGRRPLSASTRTCGSAPTTSRRSSTDAFRFPDDGGNFASATLRCVGVGKCRRTSDGAMCPSYMVDARRKAFDPRPGAAAVRDAAGRRDRRRLAQRGGQGGARPLPRLQGLQERLPGQCGHGDLQGRVPLPLLRGSAAAARGLRHGPDRPVGARSLPCARASSMSSTPSTVSAHWLKWLGGIARQRAPARVRAADLPSVVRVGVRRDAQRPPVVLCGRTRSTTTSIPRRRSRPSRCWRLPASRSIVPSGRSAAAGRSTTAACSTGQAPAARGVRDTLRPEIARRDAPIVGLEPAASAPSATSFADLFPDDETRCDLAERSMLLSEFLRERTPFTPPRLERRAIVHGHCHHHAVLDLDAEKRLLDRLGSTTSARLRLLRHGRLVRLREPITTMSRWRRGSGCCCRRCGRPTNDAHHRRRLQLPRTDRANDRSTCVSHCRAAA